MRTLTSHYSDNAQHYGLVSRILHWSMAQLLGWQFFTTLVTVLIEESPPDEFM
jgi:cytochrome b561